MELWEAGERILAAFATLLGVLVQDAAQRLIAGLVALGGLWVLNNVDLSKVGCRRSCKPPRSIAANARASSNVAYERTGLHALPSRRARSCLDGGTAATRPPDPLGGLARVRGRVAHHQLGRELAQRLAGLAGILRPVGSRPRTEIRRRLQRGGARDRPGRSRAAWSCAAASARTGRPRRLALSFMLMMMPRHSANPMSVSRWLNWPRNCRPWVEM